MPVPNWLTHCHNIRHNTLRLESPEMCAHAPKTHLHLISNAHTTCRAHMAIHFLKIMLWQHNLTTAAQQRLANEPRNLASILLHSLNNSFNMACILDARLRVGRFELPAIDIRHKSLVN